VFTGNDKTKHTFIYIKKRARKGSIKKILQKKGGAAREGMAAAAEASRAEGEVGGRLPVCGSLTDESLGVGAVRNSSCFY
jgi:hypothetical protein